MSELPAALVIAADAAGARAIPDADGPGLERLLTDRAVAWAQRVAPGRFGVLGDGEVATTDERGARIEGAAAELLDGHGPPLIIVSAVFPTLGTEHARAALEDLAHGADVVVGPSISGDWFLLAVAGLGPELSETLAGDGADSAASLFGAAARAGLAIGMLRSERALRTPGDAAALRADPLSEPSIRAALGGPPNTI